MKVLLISVSIEVYFIRNTNLGAPSQGTALDFGGERAPADSGYTKIYSNEHAFAALKADGSITTWGDTSHGGANGATPCHN
jgi:hypothetical protein